MRDLAFFSSGVFGVQAAYAVVFGEWGVAAFWASMTCAALAPVLVGWLPRARGER